MSTNEVSNDPSLGLKHEVEAPSLNENRFDHRNASCKPKITSSEDIPQQESRDEQASVNWSNYINTYAQAAAAATEPDPSSTKDLQTMDLSVDPDLGSHSFSRMEDVKTRY